MPTVCRGVFVSSPPQSCAGTFWRPGLKLAVFHVPLGPRERDVGGRPGVSGAPTPASTATVGELGALLPRRLVTRRGVVPWQRPPHAEPARHLFCHGAEPCSRSPDKR